MCNFISEVRNEKTDMKSEDSLVFSTEYMQGGIDSEIIRKCKVNLCMILHSVLWANEKKKVGVNRLGVNDTSPLEAVSFQLKGQWRITGLRRITEAHNEQFQVLIIQWSRSNEETLAVNHWGNRKLSANRWDRKKNWMHLVRFSTILLLPDQGGSVKNCSKFSNSASWARWHGKSQQHSGGLFEPNGLESCF